MFRKLIKMNPYLPAIAGLALTIAFELVFTLQELRSCKGLGCRSSMPLHVVALPMVFLIGGTAWTGRELYQQWRTMMKQSAKRSRPSSS